jgi:hypothetical protein
MCQDCGVLTDADSGKSDVYRVGVRGGTKADEAATKTAQRTTFCHGSYCQNTT